MNTAPSPLPSAYSWLTSEPGPKMLTEGLKLYGTLEGPGDANNPIILGWAKETGLDISGHYAADSIPWCGLFCAVVAQRAGKALPPTPLWALSWAMFGTKSPAPGLGDVLVFKRDGGGHVAIYLCEDYDAFHVLGGNQHDSVSITRIERSRLHAVRRPIYTNQPANVRPIYRTASGALSKNEA